MISIVTTRPDVELALVKVLSYYISSQIVRIENVSLEGHGVGYFIGGVTVHVKVNYISIQVILNSFLLISNFSCRQIRR